MLDYIFYSQSNVLIQLFFLSAILLVFKAYLHKVQHSGIQNASHLAKVALSVNEINKKNHKFGPSDGRT